MDFANFWLPIIGGILLGGFSTVAFFGGYKITGLWLGFAGVVCLLLLATLQIQAIFRNSPAASEAEQIRLRAYLSPVLAQAGDFGTERPTVVQITITNTGETPANDVRVRTGVGAGNFPMTEKFPPLITTDAPTTVGQKQSIYSVVKTKRALTHEEIEIIRAGKGAIYAVGDITYVDMFKKRHSCNFKFYYGGDVGLRPDGIMATQEKNCD
jgi:hypothetical protein